MTRLLVALGAAALAAVVWLVSPDLDYAGIKRWNLAVTGFATAVVLSRQLGWLGPRTYRLALGLTASLAVVVYFNFFSFHGGGAYVQRHDVAHYYLGSKYFAELGYGDLYTAIVRAESEVFDGTFWGSRARDLRTNELVHVQDLLDRSDSVRARFSRERWESFRADVALFRNRMGARFAKVVEDHGYNPSPVWALLGGLLANRVPAGSDAGVLGLTLLDPALEVVVFAVVARTFGFEATCLAATYAYSMFGATFTWTGGAFLRWLWLSALILAASAVEARRPRAAGALLAVSACLRVFPAFFLAGPFFRLVSGWVRERRLAQDELRMIVSFAATGALLVGVTLARSGGAAAWVAFFENLATHTKSASSNLIGITAWITYARGIDVSAPGGLDALIEWRGTVYAIQRFTIFPLAIAWIAWRSRFAGRLETFALGSIAVFAGLNLSAYYYTFLVVVVILHRDRPDRLVRIFGAECLVYALHWIEPAEVMTYLYRSLLVAYVLGSTVAWPRGAQQPPPSGTATPTSESKRNDAEFPPG